MIFFEYEQVVKIHSTYPEILDKASLLCYSLIENHPFADGNKRIGVHLTLLFLKINNIELSYTQKDLIEFGLNVASGKRPERI
ncbi:MAG: type II toxin-antitoxin system death-on-curing family toxin [Spirochaetales bacterium]|nr:type II toxin-antitoxin system death-on-curing family toxin [Spirochaetales bacterium]